MLTGFFFRHPELRDSGPMLNTSDGRSGRKLVVNGFARKRYENLDMMAAMQMHLRAAGTTQLLDDEMVIQWRLSIFDKNQRIRRAAVFLGEDCFDLSYGMVRPHLDVLDFAYP
jgi:hypothetical protein